MTAREFDAAPMLDIPDVPNFRDAGCGALRPGLLYRSASLHLLTEEGAGRIKQLGIRTVIDLRSTRELSFWPNMLHGLDVEYQHLPLLPEPGETQRTWPEDQADLYLFMAEVGGAAIAGAVRALAAGSPVLVHCAVGKDRTGLTIAVIQALAGLSEVDIVTDFLRSNPALGLDAGPIPYRDENGAERLSRPVDAAHLRAALARIRTQHTTLPAYLAAHGADASHLAALHALRTS